MFLEQTNMLTLSQNIRNIERLALFVSKNSIRVQVHDIFSIRVNIAENVVSHWLDF